MDIPELEGFNLAGGTALALQIGHRKSMDLDFFGKRPFDYDEIEELVKPLGSIRLIQRSKNILVLLLNGIKVDFVNYQYVLIEEIVKEERIRLLGLKDIAAMKLAAITGRGRKRDFTDLFFLLNYFSLEELVSCYKKKFPDGNEFLLARSLTYFDDADTDDDLYLFKPVAWDEIKHKIRLEVRGIFS